uniref:Uncharacterized protein n=1 Tax=Ditylenchus dipsaci TaxID=166011 RepID=A0A915DEL0_9BILA
MVCFLRLIHRLLFQKKHGDVSSCPSSEYSFVCWAFSFIGCKKKRRGSPRRRVQNLSVAESSTSNVKISPTLGSKKHKKKASAHKNKKAAIATTDGTLIKSDFTTNAKPAMPTLETKSEEKDQYKTYQPSKTNEQSRFTAGTVPPNNVVKKPDVKRTTEQTAEEPVDKDLEHDGYQASKTCEGTRTTEKTKTKSNINVNNVVANASPAQPSLLGKPPVSAVSEMKAF